MSRGKRLALTRIWGWLISHHITDLLSDKFFLQITYWIRLNKKLNLLNPKAFNEKMQWLKLYDRRPEYTTMVDKYEVKQYVSDRIGGQYVIPALGVWDKVEDIDFNKLPDKFVLKCTHDSGGLCLCDDKEKLNIEEEKKKLNGYLKRNFYLYGREWSYKNVKPRIIAEEYLEDDKTRELRDYKFFCFNGVPKLVYVATDRNKSGTDVKFDFFDMNFKHLPIRNGHDWAEIEPARPEKFVEMGMLAGKLSYGIPFVRCDFYESNSKLFFGEMTFYSNCGFLPFEPEEWDEKLGELIELPI